MLHKCGMTMKYNLQPVPLSLQPVPLSPHIAEITRNQSSSSGEATGFKR
jgi:hypothetical protein